MGQSPFQGKVLFYEIIQGPNFGVWAPTIGDIYGNGQKAKSPMATTGAANNINEHKSQS